MLRNRVSAQQARERKKAYLTELEARVKDLEKKNCEMEERLSTSQNENQMLRQVCQTLSPLFTSIDIDVPGYIICSTKNLLPYVIINYVSSQRKLHMYAASFH